MATNRVEVGTVTSDEDGHFLWNTGKDISLLQTIQVSFDSPSFDFAGAKWLLSFAINKATYGGLVVCFRNEICSQMPRLVVNLGVASAWHVREHHIGITGCSGRYTVSMGLKIEEAMRRRILTNTPFVISCKLQTLDAALNNVLLPESPRSVAINSNSEKEESKEDKSRLLKNLLSLSDNLKQLFQSREGCDVTLIVKDKQLQAHSAILQARSVVFSSMMSHDMVEKSSREVRIDDCEPGAVQEFLHFLYTGKVENLTRDNMQHVYYAADKYQVADLKSECVDFMKKSLTTEVVCEVIVLAAKHSEPDLFACATEYFIKNIDEVLETVQWQNFLHQHPTEANKLYIKALEMIRT